MENDSDLDKLINQFLNDERAEVKDFRQAINSFSQDLPTILNTLRNLINFQSETNNKYIQARDKFLKFCQDSINPNINKADIREMIIQHILTEDIFTNIFNDTQFNQENKIACQLQEVIKTFFTGNLKRNTLKTIESYYQVIIITTANIVNHGEKQKFLKIVYENFYKAYNPLAADKLGIVYTPNEIVKFMVESTDYLLNKHFQKTLGDRGVEILDPATGTGIFITKILEFLPCRDGETAPLRYKYQNEIHCNEVSILPYYIANLNIEYTYHQKTGEYLEFNNICLMDTLDHTTFSSKQMNVFSMTQENTENIKQQNKHKILVIIGNPPYNTNQQNENDNNKNRKYSAIDKRIKDTYIKKSTAQKTKLYDMYARFIRWASDRITDKGIIAFITNNSFINAKTFDGFRQVVREEFDYIYLLDLGGNIRTGDTTGNVFNIMVGVGILFFVKKSALLKEELKEGSKNCQIFYNSLTNLNSGQEKLQFLASHQFEQINFENIQPDDKNNWINLTDNDFDNLLPLANKQTKLAKKQTDEKAVFKLYSLGLATNRDEWVYDFNEKVLEDKVKFFAEIYKKEQQRWFSSDQTTKINDFVNRQIKWTSELEQHLIKGSCLEFNQELIIKSIYRPYVTKNLYFDRIIVHRLYQQDSFFPIGKNKSNLIITLSGSSSSKNFQCLASKTIVGLDFLEKTQCFPFYRYENGEKIENITHWGLQQFKKKYQNKNISKLNIFNYIYGVLHNPKYREKYDLNLKQDFPRIPFYNDFWQWEKWGKKLIDLHLNYKNMTPYQLKRIDIDPPPSHFLRGDQTLKPKLKVDQIKDQIIIDEVTTLENFPKIAWEYKLGNRSALEWILDQYKEKKPKDQTIVEKFNNYRFADYKEEVIDLLMRVTTVSVETMKIITQMNN